MEELDHIYAQLEARIRHLRRIQLAIRENRESRESSRNDSETEPVTTPQPAKKKSQPKPQPDTPFAVDAAPETISDAVEVILRIETKRLGKPATLHVLELKKRLKLYGFTPSTKNLTNTLNRWIARHKRFLRPEQNTFGLRGTE